MSHQTKAAPPLEPTRPRAMAGDWVRYEGDRVVLITTTEEELAGATELYRYFDHRYRLLYVGISLSTLARTATHRKESPWFHQVVHIRIDRFPTRQMAEVAERRAIHEEHPAFNTMHCRD